MGEAQGVPAKIQALTDNEAMHLAASYLETLRDLLRKALEELDGELDDNYGIGCAERYGHADDDNHAWYVAARDACGFKEKP